ncbi:MAG: class I SAM-dependent methyltransferase [Micrococcales bacterium]
MDNTSWVKKYDTATYVYTTDVNQFVVELCGPLAPGKAIDVAGGEGRNAAWLAEQGWTVEVIDFAPNALEKARKLAAERAVSDRVITTEASALDFTSRLAPVDLAVVAYLHIYSHQFAQAMAQTLAAVKPGGYIMGVWHALENLQHNSHGPQNPDTLPSVQSLTALCQDLGLKVLTLENRNGMVRTDDGPRPSVTVVLLAQKPA